MSTTIGRSLDEINQKAKQLNSTINSLVKENKELDKSLKFDSNPLEVLNKRAQNTQSSIEKLTERISLLKQKQEEYEEGLKNGSVSQNSFDKLRLDIQKAETQLAQFNDELKKTNETIKSLPTKKFSEVGNRVSKVGQSLMGVSVASAAALTGITALTLKTVSNTAELQDYADRLGITAEALQRYDYIAMQSGVETEQLVKSVAKARDAIGTALSGASNTATQALATLFGGIENIPSNAEEGFDAIIEQLSKIEDSTMQAYYANEIFGERLATNLIPMINNGSDKLKQFNREFEEIGYLSNEQIQALADFDDQMNIIKSSFAQVGSELVVALLPVMKEVVEIIQEKVIPAVRNVADFIGQLDDETIEITLNVLAFTAALGPMLTMVGKLISTLGKMPGVLTSIGNAISFIQSHPIITAIAVIIVLMTTLYAKNEDVRNSINGIFQSLSPLMKLLSDLTTGPLQSLVESLIQILQVLAPLISLIAVGLSGAISGLMLILIPVVYVLELIVKLIQSIIQGIGDLVSGNWTNAGNNQSKIWTRWFSNDFAMSSWNNFQGLMEGSSDATNYSLPDLSTITNSSNVTSNDSYAINIEISSNEVEGYNAKELADEVIKRIITEKQAMGK